MVKKTGSHHRCPLIVIVVRCTLLLYHIIVVIVKNCNKTLSW
jgi:hypothetical protein